MDIQQLIAERIGQRTPTQFAQDVIAAMPPGETLNKETVRLWLKGDTRPRTDAARTALAQALDVPAEEVFSIMGLVPPSAGIHQRVDVIERILKDRNWMTEDGQPVPVEDRATLRERAGVSRSVVEAVKDDADAAADG